MYFTILSLDGVPSGPIYYLATLTFNLMSGSKECCCLNQLALGVAARKREKNVYTSDGTFIERSVVYNVTLLL